MQLHSRGFEMFLRRSSRALGQLPRGFSAIMTGTPRPSTRSNDRQRASRPTFYPARDFHASRRLLVVKPVLLADIGEGIVECEIIQWFVEPGARVEEFSPLCEVQSDKASVEITSRFTGVVKKLYYDAGEMAKVGKPFVDIDIQGEAKREDLDALTPSEPPPPSESPANASPPPIPTPSEHHERNAEITAESGIAAAAGAATEGKKPKGKCASLATPAVRHLSKELNIDISDVDGTGRDGRVLKEDIYKFVQERDARGGAPAPASATQTQHQPPSPLSPFQPPSQPGVPGATASTQKETIVQLSHTQQMMFKTMTRSLTIPHFLYADEVDFTSLVDLRSRLNKVLASSSTGTPPTTAPSPTSSPFVTKLSYLPFIIKAVSLALFAHPTLNARVDIDPTTNRASLALRSSHNIGVAMDTPSGLLVPVIHNVQERNILSIASELLRLQSLASAGKLTPHDMSGGTITVSNIGSIGGTYLSPVVVEREVAILGVGRMRTVPAFDEQDRVVKRHVCNFSWCADHRVVDGATLARAAGIVREVVEGPDVMVMHLR